MSDTRQRDRFSQRAYIDRDRALRVVDHALLVAQRRDTDNEPVRAVDALRAVKAELEALAYIGRSSSDAPGP